MVRSVVIYQNITPDDEANAQVAPIVDRPRRHPLAAMPAGLAGERRDDLRREQVDAASVVGRVDEVANHILKAKAA